MKNILITGGLGYIGAHVANLFVKENFNVIVLDNVWHGHPNKINANKIIYGDVGNKVLLDELFSVYKFDAVIHLAGYIQVGESTQEPYKYFQNNVINTLTLLDIMLKHQCNFFIFSSTAAIFGEPHYIPIDEQHPKQPLNPYGQYKLLIEELLQTHYAREGLKFGVLRYFNAAGCDSSGTIGELHEPETHLIPLILQVVNQRREFIAIFGNDYATFDGTCIRDYIHVNDLSRAHLLLLNYLQEGGKDFFFNLGTGEGYSVKQIITAVEKITGKKVNTRIYPRRSGDPAVLIADGAKAKKILGWQSKFSNIETIITDAWNWETKLKNGATSLKGKRPFLVDLE